MLDQELLKILVCPDTRLPVKLADEQFITQLNKEIEQGKVVKKSGDKVTNPLSGGLLREDGQVLYPIQDEIPVMLIDEAIALTEHSS